MEKNTTNQLAKNINKPVNKKSTLRKIIVLITMMIMGVLMIVHRINSSFWADQFISYNYILFGVSIILIILIAIPILMDFKWFMRNELLGLILLLPDQTDFLTSNRFNPTTRIFSQSVLNIGDLLKQTIR